MHAHLHPSRAVFEKLVKEHADEIVGVSVSFNYPKNPHNPRDRRTFDKRTGGVLLDLGVYVLQQSKSFADILGVDLIENIKVAKEKEGNVRIKSTPEDNVDFEVNLSFTAQGSKRAVEFYLETQMNPGADHFEEIIIRLANGDQLTQNQFAHAHDSIGIFKEHADGSIT